jgi:ribosomal protein S18 acetylase RimI-like enzyme
MKISIKDFSIHKAQPDHIVVGLNLLKIAALDLKNREINQWSYWLDPPQERLQWLSQGFEKSEVYFIKAAKRTIAMYRLMEVDLKYWGKQPDPAVYIHSLIVHPDFKGNGIGAQIIEMIHEMAQSAGKKFLRLDCDASNLKLCNYYRQLGFTNVGFIQMELSKNALFERIAE